MKIYILHVKSADTDKRLFNVKFNNKIKFENKLYIN